MISGLRVPNSKPKQNSTVPKRAAKNPKPEATITPKRSGHDDDDDDDDDDADDDHHHHHHHDDDDDDDDDDCNPDDTQNNQRIPNPDPGPCMRFEAPLIGRRRLCPPATKGLEFRALGRQPLRKLGIQRELGALCTP